MEHSELTDYQTLRQQANSYVSYGDCLRTHEWWNKRNEVIARDQYKCTNCNAYHSEWGNIYTKTPFGTMLGRGPVRSLPTPFPNRNCALDELEVIWKDLPYPKSRILQVHHTYYLDYALPWEYPLEALVTLCDSCHLAIHEKIRIPVLNRQQQEVDTMDDCGRCHGTGYLEEYKHVESGICFECRGRKFTIQLKAD